VLNTLFFWRWIASYGRARLGRSERGASLVEYVLLLVLIVLVCVGTLAWFGAFTSGTITETGSSIST
jgi:Flp pilus assembly pilin Flp